MPTIRLITKIKSSPEICFDLSTSIDLHKVSTSQTNEKAIEGTLTGLIKLDESVTWEAVHFGIRQRLTTKITGYNRPFYFCDEQLNGAFKSMKHEHFFVLDLDHVIMEDILHFESPFGLLGRIFNKLVLTEYMIKFLVTRNAAIKEYAETGKWKTVLA